MFNPEFYMGHYEVENNVSKARETRSGRYRDIVQSAVSNRLLISYIILSSYILMRACH